MNKRGQSLSMNTIVITILVVIVLVIIALFFTGSMVSLTNKIRGLFGAELTDISIAKLKCESYCMQYQNTNLAPFRDNFCNGVTFDIDTNGDGTVDLAKQSCTDLNVICEKIRSESDQTCEK